MFRATLLRALLFSCAKRSVGVTLQPALFWGSNRSARVPMTSLFAMWELSRQLRNLHTARAEAGYSSLASLRAHRALDRPWPELSHRARYTGSTRMQGGDDNVAAVRARLIMVAGGCVERGLPLVIAVRFEHRGV